MSRCAPCVPTRWREFYRDVFELAPSEQEAPGDPNHYLTDGHVTLVIMPWDITDYDGTGIITPGMDHIGFKVESVETLKADVERIAADNPRLAPAPIGTGKEGPALEKLFERCCPLGQHRLADPDGILIDVLRGLMRLAMTAALRLRMFVAALLRHGAGRSGAGAGRRADPSPISTTASRSTGF